MIGERSVQLLRGTLDVLILKTLAAEALHGYAVAALLAQRTDGVVALEDGALYQALHRLEARGWLESAWGHAESKKRAKFYRLTANGRRQLAAETASWFQYVRAVQRVLVPEA